MNIFAIIISFVFSLFVNFTVHAQQVSQSQYPVTFVKMQSYTFPGGICYRVVKTFEPSMVTYVTTFPEHLNEKNIEDCLHSLDKTKVEIVPVDYPSMVNDLREARTQNMACTHIGQIQMPMLYQVRFSHFALTGKGVELTECMSLAAEAKNKASYLPTLPDKSVML